MLMPGTKHPFLRQVYHDVHNGYNRNILIIGKTRSGKSWSAMRLAEIWNYGRFTIKNVCWSVQQFAKLLQEGNLKDGDCVIIDEAGIGVASRSWYEQENKLFTEVMQIYGYKHLIVIFTTPAKKYIDNHARSLFDYQLETLAKDTVHKKVKLKLLKLQYNQDMDKMYRKSPVLDNMKYGTISLKSPSKKLTVAYEKGSIKWKDEFTKRMNETFKKNETKETSDDTIVETVLNNPEKYTKVIAKQKRIHIPTLMGEFNIPHNKAQKVKYLVEKKLIMPNKI